MARHTAQAAARAKKNHIPAALELLRTQWKDIATYALHHFIAHAPTPAPVPLPRTAEVTQQPKPASHFGHFTTLLHDPAQRAMLRRIADYLATGVTSEGEFENSRAEFLLSLGHSLRKYGVDGEHYPALATALRHGVERATTGEVETAATITDLACHLLAVGAAEETTPAAVSARVVEVEPRYTGERPISIIRLQMDPPQPYWAGQYLEVQAPQAPGTWRNLSPALPSNPEGLVEFHIRGVGEFSRAVATSAAVGDEWVIASSYGSLHVDTSPDAPRHVVMVAGSTGLAPLRALILDLSVIPTPPQVALYLAGRSVDELYDLMGMRGFSHAWSWLNVIPVLDHPDPRLAGARLGQVSDIVAEDIANAGAQWKEAQVVIAGPPEMISATAAAVEKAGVAPERIRYDKF